MSDAPIIRAIEKVPAAEVERATGAELQVLLGPDQGMPNFFTRQFTLAPGGRIPAHRHPDIEHQQVVLEGEMLLTLDGEQRQVRAGDAVFIPARVGHSYENRGPAPVRFLCIVPATSEYQTEWLEG